MDVYQRRRLVALSIVAVLFIAFVLLIRSCGGDDEPAPAVPVSGASGVEGATALTLAAYIDQADSACLQANNFLAAVDQTDPAAAASEQSQIVADQLDSLRNLPVPEDAPDGLQDYLSALEDQAKAYQNLAKALERGDDTAAAELQTQIDEAESAAQEAADQAGLDACGDASQTSDGGGGDDASTETTGSVETGGVTTTTPSAVPAPAPAPAPADEGGVTPPAPAPAPADGGDSGSGGVSP